MNLINNTLRPRIEPWSLPGEFAKRKYAVVDLDGAATVHVGADELVEWDPDAMERAIMESRPLRALLEDYINAGADAVIPLPEFVTSVGRWRVAVIHVVKTGWEVDIFPSSWESSYEIEEADAYDLDSDSD